LLPRFLFANAALLSQEVDSLRSSDSALQNFEFFAESAEGYGRTYPELTLHQVMRRLMRLLHERLQKNVGKAIGHHSLLFD